MNPYSFRAVDAPEGRGRAPRTISLRRGALAAITIGSASLAATVIIVTLVEVALWWWGGPLSASRVGDFDLWAHRYTWLIVVIPMLAAFTGFVTYAPARQISYARNLMNAGFGMPIAMLLGRYGMSPARIKGIDHPVMYATEFLMFFLAFMLVSCLLVAIRLYEDWDNMAGLRRT